VYPEIVTVEPRGGRSRNYVSEDYHDRRVSDEPLWGRSTASDDEHERILEFQTNPRGVEAST